MTDYNSSRTPWRIAPDYILTGDSRAKAPITKLNSWIKSSTGSNPANIRAGDKLNGSPLVSYYDLPFSTPFAVSAMIDSSNQAWPNSLWSNTSSKSTNGDTYFGNSIRLLSLIVVSGPATGGRRNLNASLRGCPMKQCAAAGRQDSPLLLAARRAGKTAKLQFFLVTFTPLPGFLHNCTSLAPNLT